MQIHGAASWRFGNNFARNVVVFGVHYSSSSHAGNYKNIFLVLGERPTDDINRSVGAAKQKFSINFDKARTNSCLSLHCNHDSSYLFVNGKEIYRFKANNGSVNFPTQFV